RPSPPRSSPTRRSRAGRPRSSTPPTRSRPRPPRPPGLSSTADTIPWSPAPPLQDHEARERGSSRVPPERNPHMVILISILGVALAALFLTVGIPAGDAYLEIGRA